MAITSVIQEVDLSPVAVQARVAEAVCNFLIESVVVYGHGGGTEPPPIGDGSGYLFDDADNSIYLAIW